MECTVHWAPSTGMGFVAETGSGHLLNMDGAPDGGGRNLAPRPMEMVLLGTGGCTAYDVVVILSKSGIDVRGCEVRLEAVRAEADPKVFTRIHFHFVVRGKGGHAAMPHMVVDPVPVAAQLIMAFQTIVSRNVKPIEAGVVSVTMVHAGEATNVVPDSVELQGTVRTFTLEVLDLIEQRMQQISEAVCAAHGTQCTFEFVRNYPPTINTAPEAEFAQAVMREILGDAGVVPQEPSMGAEDFAFMLLEKPGAYCFIANGDGVHREMGHGAGPCTLHNPSYDFNDELIPLGGTLWVRLVEKWFASK